MFNEVTYNWLSIQNKGESLVNFIYKDKYYEEIIYAKDFGPESFLSNVGGFVGIFLGYSMMQIPVLFAETLISIVRLRKDLVKGDIEKVDNLYCRIIYIYIYIIFLLLRFSFKFCF